MKAQLTCALVLVALAALFGCDDEESPRIGNGSVYAIPIAPESLIVNLQHSYRRREIEEYAKLLAPEFKFYFQPVEQGTIGKEYWNRNEESTGTRALLTTPEVSQIRLTLIPGGRDSTIDHAPPADSVRIRILTTDLQVDQTNEITWVVTDQQDMFFRRGHPLTERTLSHWFMYEWHDLPSLGSARASTRMTWGGLKIRYK